MKKFIARFRYPILLFLIFIVAEILVNPLGDYPLNDDWSYAKSVRILLLDDRLNIGNWAAMTLVSHLIWGFMFTKAFGFSFVVLRISTLISSIIGMAAMYQLSRKISGSERTGFFAALTLCFTPLFFNLSNTYMTDVNFTTWFILFALCAYYLFREDNYWMLLPILFISFLLVFMRQYGIIAPVSIAVGAYFTTRRRYLLISCGIVFTAVVYYALKVYEQQLATYLAPWSPYKFSGNVNFMQLSFIENLFKTLGARYKTIVVHVLIYSFPFACFFMAPLIRKYSRAQLLLRGTITLALTLFFCNGAKFPGGNVIMNMTLGMETFHQNWSQSVPQHNSSSVFQIVATLVLYVFTGGSIFWLMLQLFRKRNVRSSQTQSFFAFSICLFLLYVFMMLITDTFIDRYHLPLIALMLVFFSELAGGLVGSYIKGQWAFLLFAYCAVAGTRDYLLLNSKRWEAYRDLTTKGIDTEKINGGFEVNCWHDGKMDWWYDFESMEKFNYLIQFDAEPGFKLLKEYPFQRAFPPKADKINIFVRESLPDSTISKP